MAVQTLFVTSKYEYGNSAFVGSPTQPQSINIFVKTSDGFRECTLIPAAYENQRVVVNGVAYGIKTLKDACLNSHHAPLGTVAQNVWRGIAATFPILGKVVLNVSDRVLIDFHHHTKISDQIAGQTNIAGIAINGKVIRTIPMEKIDDLTNDKSNLDSETRLYLFADKIKRDLKRFGKFQTNVEKSLEPVHEVLSSILDSFEKVSSNKRDIQEIKTRMTGIRERVSALGKQDCKNLNGIAREINDVIAHVIRERKKKQPPKP